ncbi:diguanylate cyclase domain-containing protein, partial [Escherichia coli]
DRNRSHWSTSKTPSYTKSVSWQHHQCAKALAERIRENVERLTGDNPEYAIPQKVTISIGAVVTQKNELNPKEIYQLADNALYEAKETGRNKVVVKEAEILINRKDDE